MNKTRINLLAIFTLVTFLSCNNKEGNEVIAPQGMNTLNLNRFGKPFAIFVPDTLANKLSIIEQTNGALDIQVGTTFAISIYEQAADIEMKKMDLKDDEINKLSSYLAEDPTAIMWESKIVEPEFHFLLNQKIENNDYSFSDIVNTERKPFGKEAIQKMFDSSKNIIAIKKASN